MEPMLIYTVYKKPKDYPDKYVARLFKVYPNEAVPTDTVLVGNTLKQVRDQIPASFCRMPKFDEQDQNIVETWI